jgi:RNA-directed DNA polymerase
MGKHPELPTRIAKLLKQQQGKCSYCGLYFQSEDLYEVHHVDGNHHHNQWENLTLLHQHCHDQVHGGMHDQHLIIEEPDEANVSSPVLKTSGSREGIA